ncbi:hypothetical protein [Oribacterium sp. WCC10]|uniref:hypothetical protein n=1 Tax=Oribacterium sp. WCC10 TaxID=1855343 RepID=UPI0008F3B5E1|nr:hypothetical protein [Oribacterium sp. WCC10]SFG84982.1 hypothetical protein SAMN05216356_1513 [Oribacterium sp. WCC10]
MEVEAKYSYVKKLHHYSRSDPECKAKFILKNYERFPKIIAGYESNWAIIVKAEKRYNEKAASGELGVRIQKSGTSNPTMNEAIANLELSTARSETDLRHVLKGTDNPDQHVKDKLIIQDMQDDYTILCNAIYALGTKDEEMFVRYLTRENEALQDLADEYKMELANFKKQIYSIKKAVFLSTVECIDLKYGIIERR